MWAFSGCEEWRLLSSGGVGTSHCGGLQAPGTGASAVDGFCCPEVCGIFLKQGSNLCHLPWQTDS